MKWLFLLFELAGVLPLASWLKRHDKFVPIACSVLGFLALKPGFLHVDMAVISWSGFWPGYVQGFEVFLIDFLGLAILLALPSQQKRKHVPLLFGCLLYLIAATISVFQADAYEASLFYIWQLVRVFFLFYVISKASADERVPGALLFGVALAICVQAIDASWERFARGILQTGGSFGSQNLLGVLSHFIVFPAFALTLAIRRDKFFLIATAASTLIAILTTSRATVALTALGMSLVLMLSAMRGWTRRKTSIFAAGSIALVIFVPLSISSFDTRFETQKVTDIFADTSRIYMENAAKAIIANHPMGVGPNQYIVFANTHGYNQAAHVDWVNMRTNVHNSYLLIAAESGYLGLLTFVCMILPPIFLAFRYGFKVARSDLRGDILIGVGVSLLMLYLHAYYEWLFVTSQVQYLFAISLGIVSGLMRQLREHSTILASKEMIPSFTYIGRPNR